MSAMHVIVTHLTRIADKVVTMNVTLKTIIIIVETFYTICLHRIGPDISLQVRMGNINTSINNGNNGSLTIDNWLIPQCRHTIGSQAPLLIVVWVLTIVIGKMSLHGIHLIVRLSKLHLFQLLQARHQFLGL